MSRQVIVDYQGVSIQCAAQCEAAVHSLCRIDRVLKRINDTAGSLINTKIREYEQYLLESKEKTRINRSNVGIIIARKEGKK